MLPSTETYGKHTISSSRVQCCRELTPCLNGPFAMHRLQPVLLSCELSCIDVQPGKACTNSG